MKGFGTVVTGTLISGSVRKEQEVEIHPSGGACAVRGVQVYGTPAEQARAGQRTALNLADIEPADLARGMMLTEPGVVSIDSRGRLHARAAAVRQTAEASRAGAFPCRIGGDRGGSAAVRRGRRCYARRRKRSRVCPARARAAAAGRSLRHPDVLAGDHDRRRRGARQSPAALPQPGGRQRFGSRAIPKANAAERIAILVRESGFGMSLTALVARTGMLAREIESSRTDKRFVNTTAAGILGDGRGMVPVAARENLARRSREFHRKNPLRRASPSRICAARWPRLRARRAARGPRQIVVEGDTVRLATHKLVLREDEERARGAIERAFEQAGLAVPALAETLAKSGVELKRARSILQILIRERKLVRITDDLVFHHSAIGTLKALLSRAAPSDFGVPAFKDWTGISRKYAIPLLEYLDRERITRREGDERIVL